MIVITETRVPFHFPNFQIDETNSSIIYFVSVLFSFFVFLQFPTSSPQVPNRVLMVDCGAKAILLCNKWYGYRQHWVSHSFSHRKKMDIKVKAVTSSDLNPKKANLFAMKKERVKLPTYDDVLGGKKYHISEFLSQPSGIAAVLNTKALQSLQSVDVNTYRCELPKLRFLNFEASPFVDLRVTSTNEDCLVEMISCKFEGSEVVEEQNNHFSAFMINHMTWGGADAESYFEVDVKLNLTLEIYTRPFTMMPTSAVEGPGNIMMQALVDKLVPLLLQQMLRDYDEWVQEQLDSLNQSYG